MPSFVDGFVIPVPKSKVKQYVAMAKKCSKIWKDHGALEIRECVGDDLNCGFAVTFPKLAKLKANETVFFSWIVFKSRAHRDKVNAAVMKDPRLAGMMDMKNLPFDCKRMTYGGFKAVVEA